MDSETSTNTENQALDDFAGWQERGVYFQEHGRYKEAANAFEQCIVLNPSAAAAWSNLGLSYRAQDRFPEALRTMIHATRLAPDWPIGWMNLATLCGLMGLYEQGVEAAECAVQLRPERAESWGVLGNLLRFAGRLEEAHRAYEQGLKLDPRQPSLNWNQAEVLLMMGDWKHGFAAYEWRHRRAGYTPAWWGRKLWRGEQLEGTLLLHAEQGFGDTLQFARFVALARPRVGRVVLRCHPRLMQVMSSVVGVDLVVSKYDVIPPFDKQHFLMSLPHLLQCTSIPATLSYLSCEIGSFPQPVQDAQGDGRFRIGLGWQGNPSFKRDHLRSMPLSRMQPLSELPDVALFSLQKGDGAAQIGGCGFPVIDLSAHLDCGEAAFVDTIQTMRAMDLIVTTDTSLAHLAGAIGVETWVLLSYAPDWRWGLDKENCTWYPNMRLYRQQEPLDWAGVIQRVAGAIRFRQYRKRWGGEVASLDLDSRTGNRVWPKH